MLGTDSLIGQTISHYRIIEKLGGGGMGVVYKAEDTRLHRAVGVKFLPSEMLHDSAALERFCREAQAASALNHPNICTIYDIAEQDGQQFIAMEFLTGESLDKLIARRARMSLSQKLSYIVYVCRALEYAHRQNPPVIHRDIKPGNVMVTSDGTVKVVDFGIARQGEGSHSQSSGMLIGTLGYMSPQQFRGGSADARSDIWATGIMLYELLCYHRPFDAENPGALKSSIILNQHRPISEAAPGTPSEVEAIVDRMLCKELSARYQNMEEVLMELEPVWNQVREVEVSILVADGRQFFEARDLAKAEDIVRKALQIDASNSQAKSLLETINAERRKEEQERLLEAVRTMIKQGDFAEATSLLQESVKQLSQLESETAQLKGKIEERRREEQRRKEEQGSHLSPGNSVPAPSQALSPILDPTRVPRDMLIDNVHFTLTGPLVLAPGATYELQFWLHVEQQRSTVLEAASVLHRLPQSEVAVKSEGPYPLQRGSRIGVRLKIDGLRCLDNHKLLMWTGEIGNTAFVVEVPPGASEGAYAGTASIRLNGCEIAKMSFFVRVGPPILTMNEIPSQTRSHRNAFASYASEDRVEVLSRIQGMEAAFKGLHVFVDLIDLRSGQNWERELAERISKSEVFYLFWCRHAMNSNWVDKEWHWALAAKGQDFIDPVPLEGPELAPPPKELAAKHFNDPLLAFIAAAGGVHSD